MEYTEKLERLYAEWEQQVEERGREQAMEQAFREAFVTVYETRFGEMPEELRAALARIHEEEQLRRLTVLGVNHPHEDVISAVRQASQAG